MAALANHPRRTRPGEERDELVEFRNPGPQPAAHTEISRVHEIIQRPACHTTPTTGPWADMNDHHPRRTYTVEEAARELGISRSTAYECVRTGELPCLRFRSRIVIVAEVVDQMLSASPTSSTPPDDIGW